MKVVEKLWKKWTDSEQRHLEQLLNDGSLRLTDPSSKVKDFDDDLFYNYRNNVIGYHLGLLRKKK